MSIGPEEVKKVAHLARLAIDAQDIDKYTQDLSNILDLVEQMKTVDTKHVEPSFHSIAASQRLREDVVSEQDQRDLFQSIAPATEAGLYLVNQVIE